MLSVSFLFFSSFYDLAHFLWGLLKLQADRQSWTKTPASPLTIHVDINGAPKGKKGQSLFTLQTNNNIFLSPSWCKRLHTHSLNADTSAISVPITNSPQRYSSSSLLRSWGGETFLSFDFWPSRLPNVAHMTFDCSAKCRDASFKCYSTSIFSVPASTLCSRGLDIVVSNLIMFTYH